MSVYAGPEISNNGLVYSIDAANDKSYSRNHFLALGSSGPGAASDNNVTFPVNGTGTFVRLGYGQTFGEYTIQPNDVVYKYVLGVTGCHYHGFDTTIIVGAYATFSFDYYISSDAVGVASSGDPSLLAVFENAFSNAVYLPNTKLGVWQRISFTSGPRAVAPETLRSLLYPGGCSSSRLATSGYILFKNPIVEFSQTASSGIFTSRTANNTVTDISGSNITSTLTNGTSRVNDAFVFDGTDDNITTNLTPNKDAGSVISWINMTSLKDYNTIFDNAVGTDDWECWVYATGQCSFRTTLDNSDIRLNSSTNLSANVWYQVCVTWSPSGGNMYINGTLVSSDTSTGTRTTPGVLNIGGINNTKFNGRITSFQVYNRQLTPAEIKQNFNALRGRFGI